jgi:hypothetical protein
MADVLRQCEARKVANVHFEFRNEDEKRKFENASDVFEFLE